MVKKYAPGHSYKQQKWASHAIPKFLLSTVMTELPSCTSWLLLWRKNSLTKILSFNPESQNGMGFFSDSMDLQESLVRKMAKKKPGSDAQHQTDIQWWEAGGGRNEWMREVSIFCQLHLYKYYSIKVVSLPPIRKPWRYHHLMTLPWEQGHQYQMSKQYIIPAALWSWDHVL